MKVNFTLLCGHGEVSQIPNQNVLEEKALVQGPDSRGVRESRSKWPPTMTHTENFLSLMSGVHMLVLVSDGLGLNPTSHPGDLWPVMSS